MIRNVWERTEDMSKRPNIIMILTDDQGAWAMHCAGNKEIYTPNLDSLAENGIRFHNFFCASPVCSPARASILTGCIPSQHGVHDWIRSGNLRKLDLGEKKEDPYYQNEDVPIQYLEGFTTYTDILARNGYTCALAGKWHLGDSMTPQHGFTKWFTIGRGGCYYNKADIVEDGKLYFDHRYVTDLITDKAIDYIEELSEEENPYYISVNYTAPHSPWEEDQHPKEFVDLYRDCPFNSTPDLPIHPNQIPTAPYGEGEMRKTLLRGYYAAITAMDAGVGKIMEKLREKGELENTLIIFTSDNGMNMGHHGIWGKGNGTFPLNLYDTAIKVPFIISHPKEIKKGVVEERLSSHYDIIHTLLEYLDIDEKLPDTLPGKSFRDSLDGKSTENHIVIFDEYGANRMIRNKEWKYIHRYPYGPNELYHLAEDPEEENNLIHVSKYDSIREELYFHLQEWYLKYVDPRVDGVKEDVTGYGQLRTSGIYSKGKQVYWK